MQKDQRVTSDRASVEDAPRSAVLQVLVSNQSISTLRSVVKMLSSNLWLIVGLVLTLSLPAFAAHKRTSKLSLVVSPPQLSARREEGTFAITKVHGILGIQVENASVVSISDYRRSGTTVYIRISRLGGGATLLRFHDSRGASGILPVDIGGCSWPQPRFSLLFPATLNVINTAEPYSATFSYSDTGLITSNRATVTDQDLILAEEDQFSSPTLAGSDYRARIWSQDGIVRESEYLQQISKDDVPRAVLESGAPLMNAKFFKASVHNLVRNKSYSVQIWNPTKHCPPPINLGAITVHDDLEIR